MGRRYDVLEILNTDEKWDEIIKNTKELKQIRRLVKIDILKGVTYDIPHDLREVVCQMVCEIASKKNMKYCDITMFCIPSPMHKCFRHFFILHSDIEMKKYQIQENRVTKEIEKFINQKEDDQYTLMRMDEKKHIPIHYYEEEVEEDVHHSAVINQQAGKGETSQNVCGQ